MHKSVVYSMVLLKFVNVQLLFSPCLLTLSLLLYLIFIKLDYPTPRHKLSLTIRDIYAINQQWLIEILRCNRY